MLKIKVKLSALLFVLFVLGSSGANFAKAADTPEQTTKSFYQWYLAELNREDGNPSERKAERKATILKSVSKRLVKFIYSPAYEEYGADYFIDAQDFDENWQVTTTKAVIKGNRARLKVLLAAPKGKKSHFKQTLIVKMVKEGGAWKIDSVNNMEFST